MRSNSSSRSTPLSRRKLLKETGAAAVLLGAAASVPRTLAAESEPYKIKSGRIRQSVVLWCFNPMPPETLAGHAADLGLSSVELIAPKYWPELKKRGLACAISSSHGFAKGFAQPGEHDECIQTLRQSIDDTAAAGFGNVITFSGYRKGLSTEDATRNMVEGLKKIVGYAEKKNVTLCLEMLNSRVNVTMKGHPDYFCDNIDLAADICRQISSERMKLLFDIYHVQIMHGDIISRIRQYHPYIAHYHTAGNPGRNEIDASQEINYPGIVKAILQTGYKGFLGQEFIPTGDPVASLSQAARICDV
jgi:hydroxypyruvate isomerase